jgi:hypothetical protein
VLGLDYFYLFSSFGFEHHHHHHHHHMACSTFLNIWISTCPSAFHLGTFDFFIDHWGCIIPRFNCFYNPHTWSWCGVWSKSRFFCKKHLLSSTRTHKGYFSSIMKGLSNMVFHHLKCMCLGSVSFAFIHCN